MRTIHLRMVKHHGPEHAAGIAEYLTVGDAAFLLGLSGDAIRKASREGRLTLAAKTPSGRRLFLRSDVEAFRRRRLERRPR